MGSLSAAALSLPRAERLSSGLPACRLIGATNGKHSSVTLRASASARDRWLQKPNRCETEQDAQMNFSCPIPFYPANIRHCEARTSSFMNAAAVWHPARYFFAVSLRRLCCTETADELLQDHRRLRELQRVAACRFAVVAVRLRRCTAAQQPEVRIDAVVLRKLELRVDREHHACVVALVVEAEAGDPAH